LLINDWSDIERLEREEGIPNRQIIFIEDKVELMIWQLLF